MKYCTTRDYFLSQKPFKQSSSVDTTTAFWQNILVLIKLRTSLIGNTIGRVSEKTLGSMSKVVIYAWAQKQLDTSPMETYNPCLYQLIDGKTSQQILSLDYGFQPTGKVTAMTLYQSLLTGLQKWCITSQSKSPLMLQGQLRSFQTWQSDTTACQTQSCLIKVHFLPQSFDHCFATSSTSNGGSQLLSIPKQTARPNSKTAQWRYTSEPFLTLNKITEKNFC